MTPEVVKNGRPIGGTLGDTELLGAKEKAAAFCDVASATHFSASPSVACQSVLWQLGQSMTILNKI